MLVFPETAWWPPFEYRPPICIALLANQSCELNSQCQRESLKKNYATLAWIGLGLIAGFVGSKLVNKSGGGMMLDIVLGIVGAIVGGWLFNIFGASGVNGLNLYSLLVAIVGSVVLLVTYHAIRRV